MLLIDKISVAFVRRTLKATATNINSLSRPWGLLCEKPFFPLSNLSFLYHTSAAVKKNLVNVKTERISLSDTVEFCVDVFDDEQFSNDSLLEFYVNTSKVNRIPFRYKALASNKSSQTDVTSVPHSVEFDDESSFSDGPITVLDLNDIILKTEKWARLLPRVQPFYAVKCNSNEMILKMLAHAMQFISPEVAAKANYSTVGFDCASKDELQKVLGLGVAANTRIVFAHPCKMTSHLQYARDQGVEMMTFDSLSELYKIKCLNVQNAKLVLRLRVDDTSSQCPLGSKYGCELDHVEALLLAAKKLDLPVVGVSFHVGSFCRDPTAFRLALEQTRKVFDLSETLGFKFSLLDIGGGFPGHKNSPIQMEPFAETINKSLDQYFPQSRNAHVTFIAEPGLYFAGSAMSLFVEIIGKKLPHETLRGEIMYYVNDGVYGSINCKFNNPSLKLHLTVPRYLNQHEQPDGVNPTPVENKQCSVWGPTCCSLDRIMENIMLPELEIGDWLIFEDMGAYSTATASPFNGFPAPVMKTACKRSVWENIASSLRTVA